MDSAGFDVANWSHWLLVSCFVAVSLWGLVLSWQWSAYKRTRRKWNKRMQAERKRVELLHPLKIDSYEVPRQLPKALNLSAVRDASRK